MLPIVPTFCKFFRRVIVLWGGFQSFNINVAAYDQDIYTKPSELASAVIPLSQKYKEICGRREGVELMSHLKQVPKVRRRFIENSKKIIVNFNFFSSS